MALAQSDLKKLVAYSSVSHMGFVTLGIFVFNSQGIQGAVLQMFNHGITTAALFIAIGLLYERTHSRAISDYGGLHKPMPRFVAFFFLFSVAAFGLPGTCNFIGEFLVLVGTSYVSFAMVLISMGGISFSCRIYVVDASKGCVGRCIDRNSQKAPRFIESGIGYVNSIGFACIVYWIVSGPINRDDGCQCNSPYQTSHRAGSC